MPDQGDFDPNCHLSVSDIALSKESAPWFFVVNVKRSKTDQFGAGAEVILGATGSAVCPVAALLDILTVRGENPGPLFMAEGGRPLRRSGFVQHVQAALAASGLPSLNFNGHSFRIGAATSASVAMVPESTIKVLGRWKSQAYQRYIRPTDVDLAHVSRQLASSFSTPEAPGQ